MLLNLEVRRKDAIEAGDLDTVSKIDRDIERIEAALDGRPPPRRAGGSSAKGKKKGPGCILTGVIVLFVLYAIGILSDTQGSSSVSDPVTPDTDRAYPTVNDQSAAAEASGGAWRVSRTQSAMDDSRGVTLVLEADNRTSATLGTTYASLFVACKENSTTIAIDWDTFVNNESVPVTYRIDDAPATTRTWNVSTDYELTGRWNGTGIDLIRQLAEADRFVVEVTPYGDGVQQARFNVSGLDTHLPDLAEACGWSYP